MGYGRVWVIRAMGYEGVDFILKNHFRILQPSPDVDMGIQALIPPALTAIHNFICKYDNEEINDYITDNMEDPQPGGREGELATAPARRHEKQEADQRKEIITQKMWNQYQQELAHRV